VLKADIFCKTKFCETIKNIEIEKWPLKLPCFQEVLVGVEKIKTKFDDEGVRIAMYMIWNLLLERQPRMLVAFQH